MRRDYIDIWYDTKLNNNNNKFLLLLLLLYDNGPFLFLLIPSWLASFSFFLFLFLCFYLKFKNFELGKQKRNTKSVLFFWCGLHNLYMKLPLTVSNCTWNVMKGRKEGRKEREMFSTPSSKGIGLFSP